MRRIFSVQQVCEMHNISRGELYKRMREGDGPRPIKIGRRTLFTEDELDAWHRRLQDAAYSAATQNAENTVPPDDTSDTDDLPSDLAGLVNERGREWLRRARSKAKAAA